MIRRWILVEARDIWSYPRLLSIAAVAVWWHQVRYRVGASTLLLATRVLDKVSTWWCVNILLSCRFVPQIKLDSSRNHLAHEKTKSLTAGPPANSGLVITKLRNRSRPSLRLLKKRGRNLETTLLGGSKGIADRECGKVIRSRARRRSNSE